MCACVRMDVSVQPTEGVGIFPVGSWVDYCYLLDRLALLGGPFSSPSQFVLYCGHFGCPKCHTELIAVT